MVEDGDEFSASTLAKNRRGERGKYRHNVPKANPIQLTIMMTKVSLISAIWQPPNYSPTHPPTHVRACVYLGEPEINEFGVAVARHHDVLRLQIAKHEVLGVHMAHAKHQIRHQKLHSHGEREKEREAYLPQDRSRSRRSILRHRYRRREIKAHVSTQARRSTRTRWNQLAEKKFGFQREGIR